MPTGDGTRLAGCVVHSRRVAPVMNEVKRGGDVQHVHDAARRPDRPNELLTACSTIRFLRPAVEIGDQPKGIRCDGKPCGPTNDEFTEVCIHRPHRT